MPELQTLLTVLLVVSTVLGNVTDVSSLSKRNSGSRQEFTDKDGILRAYQTAQIKAIMLDYDGTLVPFVNDPDKAVPSKELLFDLETLAAAPKNTVWIISGRDKYFLNKHFGSINGLGLSAEHGAFIKNPGQPWKSLGEQFDIAEWRKGAIKIMETWTDKTPGSRVEPKEYSLTWHYRQVATGGHEAAIKLSEDLIHARDANGWDMLVLQDAKVVEVKSRYLDKGQIVRDIIFRSWEGRLHDSTPGSLIDFIFNAGDSISDEHMFRAVANSPYVKKQGVYTMWVQHDNMPDRLTEAKYKVHQPKNQNEDMTWNAPPSLLRLLASVSVFHEAVALQ